MSPDRETPVVEAPPVVAAEAAVEAPVNHEARGRELAGRASEKVGGIFSKMREKFNGFKAKVSERTKGLTEKGANLLFSGIGAGDYFAKKSAEKAIEVKEKTVAKKDEVVGRYEAKKSEWASKRDATIESWGDSISMAKVKAEMRRLDKNMPLQSAAEIDASEQASTEQIQQQMEAQMQQMQEYHQGEREKIAAKEALQARIDAILAKRGAGVAPQQVEQAA
ncbi:hypothetical protein BH11PAT4_BH11PAT4_7970 [soil metagenome]